MLQGWCPHRLRSSLSRSNASCRTLVSATVMLHRRSIRHRINNRNFIQAAHRCRCWSRATPMQGITLPSSDTAAPAPPVAASVSQSMQECRVSEPSSSDVILEGPPVSAAAPDPNPQNTPPAVMLILTGAPGSGKSTFAQRLLKGATVPWHHVNQDTIKKGSKPGSQQDCLTSASKALDKGVNVVVDRCNSSVDQRVNFVSLAQAKGCAVHCVVLQPPYDVCRARAMARTDHPTLKPGPGVTMVVSKFHGQIRNALPEKQTEGLASVTVCPDSDTWDAALSAWLRYPQPGWDAAVESVGAQGRVIWAKVLADAERAKAEKAKAKAEAGKAPKGQKTLEGWLKKPAQVAGGPCKGDGAAVAGTSGGGAQEKGERQQGATALAGTKRSRSKSPEGSNPVSLLSPGLGPGSKQEPAAGTGGSDAAAHAPAAGQARVAVAASGATAAAAGAGPGAQKGGASKAFGGPLAALQLLAQDPARWTTGVEDTWWDEELVRLPDKFPKARFHTLVVARDPALRSVSELRPQHLPLLERMRDVGEAWAQQQHGSAPFRMGFHQIPSLPQLHLHVISQDFNSPGLKNKKHWNSFTSPYFLPMALAVQQLQQHGHISVDKAAMEQLLKRDLVCHRTGCGRSFRTMPELKSHIAACHHPHPN